MNAMKKAATILMATIMMSMTSAASADVNIDWDSGIAQTIGTGAWIVSGKHDIMFFTYARQAAMLDAFRSIVEAALGVEVVQYGEEKFYTYIKNPSRNLRARQLDITFYEDGTCEVQTEMKIWGENSLASEIAFVHLKNQLPIPYPKSRNPVYPTTQYTGVIIDCRGQDLERAVAPSIRTEEGRIVYDCRYLGYNKVVERGMVQYCTDPNKQTRAGSRPLLVKALALYDKRRVPIISDDDADLILSLNRMSGILDKMNVVIVD